MTETERAGARVAIALDALSRVREVDWGPGSFFLGELAVSPSADLSAQVDTVQSFCSVCALAGLLLSTARCYDSIPMLALLDERAAMVAPLKTSLTNCRQKICQPLLAYFDQRQLDLIESAFERRQCGPSLGYPGEDAQKEAAVVFGVRAGDSLKRITAILTNIIDNGGIFVPPPVEPVPF